VPADLYEEIRGDGARFVVLRGHAAPRMERLLADGGTYAVVEASPAAA
jgi:hypothetical protein